MKLTFDNVTLVIIDCLGVERCLDVIEICKYYANFKNIKFFTSLETESKYKVPIEHIHNLDEYSIFVLTKLNDYINTDYILIVQHDGFILNPKAWTDEFYNYDFIGAPITNELFCMRNVVGNGGFSFRSKKLLSLTQKIFSKFGFNQYTMYDEDIIIGYTFRKTLESYGIKFAPVELADKFSVETKKEWNGQFGFHGFKYINPFKEGWECPNINYLTKIFKNKEI